MKVVIPGGSGQVGQVLKRHFQGRGDQVVIIGRHSSEEGNRWDGKSLGRWTEQIDGSDVVINLAGRTVNCRYTNENLRQMMDSRVNSTRAIGQAIAQSQTPPRVWLQMSTATIYAHRFDQANDEKSGVMGGSEPGVPAYWRRSIEIAKAWERALEQAETPGTRKVALRTAMVMSPDRDGVFDVLCGLTKRWLGGRIGSGKQYMSWIHHVDFCRAIDRLIRDDALEGAVNLASPNPLPQAEFQTELRKALRVAVGLPATKWMAEIGAVFMKTDTELVLKSRRVVPGRLADAGFEFRFPQWREAVADLVSET